MRRAHAVPPRAAALLFLLLLLPAAACSDGTGGDPALLASVRIDSGELLLLAGDSAVVRVEGLTRTGAPAAVDPAAVQWRTLNRFAAAVRPGGLSAVVVGVDPGEALVVAEVGAAADTLRVKVFSAPDRLEVVGGNGQGGVPGAALPESVTVRVLDAEGKPLSLVRLRFAVASGGGRVSPEVADSRSEGVARAAWTLGPEGGSSGCG